MKSFRSLFLILLVLFSISIGFVFADDSKTIDYTKDDTHAHWPDDGLTAASHEIPKDGAYHTVIYDLNTQCDSYVDNVVGNYYDEGDCVDAKFWIKSQDTTKVVFRLGSSGTSTGGSSGGNKRLDCMGISYSTHDIVVSGYPKGETWGSCTQFLGCNENDRRAVGNIEIVVIGADPLVASDVTITAESSGADVTASGSCSGGTEDYDYSIPLGQSYTGTAAISESSGLITYTPAANSAGDTDFTYQCKGIFKTDTALVEVVISAADDPAPEWEDIPQSKKELFEDTPSGSDEAFLFKLNAVLN